MSASNIITLGVETDNWSIDGQLHDDGPGIKMFT